MWVDIANLMGPKGADGADGQRGEPGPVNIGLNPDEPIAWDQSGGFTFNFVDGSEQTVNLPIASAQSAGLLGAGGLMPGTGVVDLTPNAAGIGNGQVIAFRVGPMVTLSIFEVSFTNTVSGWGSVLTLPARFRPPTTMRQNLVDVGSGAQAAVYASGGLWMNRVAGITYRYIMSWATEAPLA